MLSVQGVLLIVYDIESVFGTHIPISLSIKENQPEERSKGV